MAFMKTIEELFPLDTLPEPKGPIHNNRKVFKKSSYPVFSLNIFEELLSYLKGLAQNKVDEEDDLEPDQRTKIRYVLLPNSFQLLLGAEGIADSKIPAHFQLTGEPKPQAKCIAAGNLFLDDKQKIIKINNKSGDYQLPFSTIQWVLLTLLAYNEGQLLADEITVEDARNPKKHFINTKNEATRQWKEKLTASLAKKIPGNFSLKQTIDNILIREYTAPTPSALAEAIAATQQPMPRRRALNFFDGTEAPPAKRQVEHEDDGAKEPGKRKIEPIPLLL